MLRDQSINKIQDLMNQPLEKPMGLLISPEDMQVDFVYKLQTPHFTVEAVVAEEAARQSDLALVRVIMCSAVQKCSMVLCSAVLCIAIQYYSALLCSVVQYYSHSPL